MVSYYNSPIGIIKIIEENDYITDLDFTDDEIININLNDEFNKNDSSEIEKCKIQLNEYFLGKRKVFNVKIKQNGTEFRKKVWNELCNIPYGHTYSYKQIGEKIGCPKSSRAVGGANNKNTISIIVPCHRVIGANKKLVGYAGGLWRKEWLLNHEKQFSC